MTPTHKQIVESLKRIAQSNGTREDYARCSAAGLTGDWPNPQGPGMYPAGWVVLGVVKELDEVAAAGMSLADSLEDAKEEFDRVLHGITEILQTCEPTADSVLEAVRAVDEMARKNGQEAWAQGQRIGGGIMGWKYVKWTGPGNPPTWNFEDRENGFRGWCRKRKGRRSGQNDSWEWYASVFGGQRTDGSYADNELGAKYAVAWAIERLIEGLLAKAREEKERAGAEIMNAKAKP